MAELNHFQQLQKQADTSAAELIKDRERSHEAMEQRMSEQLRFLTERDMQQRQQLQSIADYYPQYGRASGFTGGMISGASAVAGGYGGIHLSRALGFGKLGQVLTPALAAMTAYGTASTIYDEGAGSEDSLSGAYNRNIMNQVLPMASYHARSNWQTQEGYIQSPELFRTSVAAPADAIARSFNLNPAQFLPGAMDLMREGMVAPTSAESGRSITTALKESALIFKAIQSFFGSVDIAGLTQQIKTLQAAGFTPEGMTDLGRAMQQSTLAFAPENIKQMVYQQVVQTGGQLSQYGVSAHLGGQAAVMGMEAGYRGFGKLSAYDRTIFRTQEQYGQAITGVFSSGMANPFLTLGRGDAMEGLMSASSRFDLATAQGQRDFKRQMYEVTSQLSATDFIKAKDSQVEQAMQVFGMDRESAAASVFGSTEQARAYMLEREQRGDLLASNVKALTGTRMGMQIMSESDILGTLKNASSEIDTPARLQALRKLRGNSSQASALRHMINARTMSSRGFDAEDITAGDVAGGYFNRRAFGRLVAGTYEAGGDWVDTELNSMLDPSMGATSVPRLRNVAGASEDIALTLSGLTRGYSEGYGDNVDGDVERAVERYRRSGQSVLIRDRLEEELRSSGRGARSGEVMAGVMRSEGLGEVAAIMADPRKAGQFLRRLEKYDKRSAEAISRSFTGQRSLDPMKAMLSSLNSDVVRPMEDSVLNTIGTAMQNPLVSAGSMVAGGIVMGLVTGGNPLGIAKGAFFAPVLTQYLGKGLSSLSTLSEGHISEDLAKQINAGAYGAHAVVMAIVGSMPEDMFSAPKAFAGVVVNDRIQATEIVSRIMYGNMREEIQKNPDAGPEGLWGVIRDALINDLSAVSKSNYYASVLVEHYRNNPGVIRKAVEVIYGYMKGVDTPENEEVITSRVRESVEKAAKEGLTGTTQKQTITGYRQALMHNTSDLATRAGVQDAAVVQKEGRLFASISDVLSSKVTTSDGKKITDPTKIRDLYNAIQSSVAGLSDSEQRDPAKLEQVMKQAVEGQGYKAKGAVSDILAAIQGQVATKESSIKLSETTKQILKSILDDGELTMQLRKVLQPASS